jgi:tetratricopeptide (TPR) repeat protein
LALAELAVRRDPVNATTQHNLGVNQLAAGQTDAAIATFRTVLTLNPNRAGVYYELSAALLFKGDANAALAAIEQEHSEIWRMIGLPIVYYALGRKAESDAALAALVAKYSVDGAYNIAYIHAFRGEADLAFEWLEKVRANGDPLAEILAEPYFAKIHDDPRWIPLLRKIGKAPEQIEKIKFKVTLPNA